MRLTRKTHAAWLAFALLAAVVAAAQAPGSSAGNQSAIPPNAQLPASVSGDANARAPVSENQNNGPLQSQIENALRNEPSLSNSHIVVNVSAESIDLSGTVGSSKDKQIAERIAQSFDGNCKLNDNLMITGHGNSDLAPDHSAMNNSVTGNAQKPATSQDNTGTNNRPGTPPKT